MWRIPGPPVPQVTSSGNAGEIEGQFAALPGTRLKNARSGVAIGRVPVPSSGRGALARPGWMPNPLSIRRKC